MSYDTKNQGAVTTGYPNSVTLTAGNYKLESYNQSINQVSSLAGTTSGSSGILARTGTFNTLENVTSVNETTATYFKVSSISN